MHKMILYVCGYAALLFFIPQLSVARHEGLRSSLFALITACVRPASGSAALATSATNSATKCAAASTVGSGALSSAVGRALGPELARACLKVLGAACHRHAEAANTLAFSDGFEDAVAAALEPARALCSAWPTRTQESRRPWMLGTEVTPAAYFY